MSEKNKVVKFKKRKRINIGIVVFLILFLYIAINVYIYLTKEKLTIYEVHTGTTEVDNQVTGLILRQEELVSSEKGGYILYYQKDGARVAKASSIYSINDNQIYNTDNSNNEKIKFSDKSKAEIRHQINNFQTYFSNDNFESVYDFQDNIHNVVLDAKNSALISEGQASKAAAPALSEKSGIVTYYMDGFETITPTSITADMFQKESYKKQNLRTTDKIAKNTPVYKLITSQKWNLVVPLKKDQYLKLKEKERVTFTVLQDDLKLTAELELDTKGDEYYAILNLDQSLGQYLGERYLDISLELDYTSGLKIPLSSIVEKDFYEVPKDYFTLGGDSMKNGLNKISYEDGEMKTLFIPTDIYYEDDEFKYVDTQLFEAGTPILSPKSSEQYILSKTIKLTGVYNVNQGYAIFKRIEKLTENDEYSIVKEDTKKGLSAYDHIILNGDIAVNQEIIY